MRAWIFAVCVVAACGGGHTIDPDACLCDPFFPDGLPIDTCNPVSQTGCNPEQKCAWIRFAASASSQMGEVGCVPSGKKQLGEACVFGDNGVTTGYDDCAAGLVCDASTSVDRATGVCIAICDTGAAPGAIGACAASFACESRAGYFANSGEPQTTIGLCDHTCDPLTNMRDDGVANCGGVVTNGVSSVGCYGLPASHYQPNTFTCAPTLDPSKASDALAYDATTGVQINSCAPGYIPLLYTSTATYGIDTDVICVAYCQPAPTSLESHSEAAGAAPHDCATAGAGGTHECRYWWFLEDGSTPIDTWSNGLGYCLDFTNYTFDGTSLHPPRTATEPEPSCTILSSTAMTYDAGLGGKQTEPDVVYWGCAPRSPGFTRSAPPARPRAR